MSSSWRDVLAQVVQQGLAESGLDAVSEALSGEAARLADHPDAAVEPFRPAVPVLGIVPCETGFLGVLVQVDGRVTVHVARSSAALLDQVTESVEGAVVVDQVEPAEAGERRELLARAGLTVPAWFSGSGFTESDLLDGCAAVVIGAN